MVEEVPAHPLLYPSWHNATGQLIGFLAYDLVLIGPFLGHLSDVADDHRMSLYIYLTVVIYSGALAAYYLLTNRATRLGDLRPVLAELERPHSPANRT